MQWYPNWWVPSPNGCPLLNGALQLEVEYAPVTKRTTLARTDACSRAPPEPLQQSLALISITLILEENFYQMELFIDDDDGEIEENEYYAAYPYSEYAWLYIAVDIRDMSIVKVGLTTKKTPQQRVAEGKTYNPFITLFTTYELSRCTFGVSSKELSDIEGYIHSRSNFGKPIKHLYTGRDSEWFYIDPEEAESQIDWILAKRGFSVDGKKLYSYDDNDQKFNGINVREMRKIKTIFRPSPEVFKSVANRSEIPLDCYRDYYELLKDFHSRDANAKIYY